MTKFSPWIVSAILAQISTILYFENSSLRSENKICLAASDILRDQIAELSFSVSRISSERDYVATKNYVLGATQAIRNPEKFGDLWHDGYTRGLNQTKYVSEHLSE